jgi:WD40 repeat protein
MVYSVAFSPDGKLALTGSMDNTARLWDAQTGQQKALLKGHTGTVHSVAFSPNGKLALTGSWDNTARLWDAQTGQQKAILNGHTGLVLSVCFSPDGKLALTGSNDKTARVWDTETGQQMAILNGHTREVWSVAFSPDGKRALTGSADWTARLWDAETGKEKALLMRHTGVVRSVAFSPDGTRALTGSSDKTARLWDAETEEARARQELLKYQGTWKRPSDGSQIKIEGPTLTWTTGDGKVVGTARLTIVAIDKDKAKVASLTLTGDDKGSTGKAIVHRRNADTLYFLGATATGVTLDSDGYPEAFSEDYEWKKVPPAARND